MANKATDEITCPAQAHPNSAPKVLKSHGYKGSSQVLFMVPGCRVAQVSRRYRSQSKPAGQAIWTKIRPFHQHKNQAVPRPANNGDSCTTLWDRPVEDMPKYRPFVYR